MIQCTTQHHSILLPYQNFYCPEGNKAASICAAQRCFNYPPFICQDINCACKNVRHHACVSIKIDELSQKIQKNRIIITQQMQIAIENIRTKYDQIQQQISNRRRQFEEYIDYFGLGKHSIRLIQFLQNGDHNKPCQGLTFQSNKQLQTTNSHIPVYQIQISQLQQKLIEQLASLKECYNSLYQGEQILTEQDYDKIKYCQSFEKYPLWDYTHSARVNFDIWQQSGKKLRQITHCSLYFITLQDISPNFSVFYNLEKLSLYSCKIKNIINLDRFRYLTELDLGSNAIEKIENLQNLIYLKDLELGNNQIKQICNMEKLTALTLLDLNSNKIEKLEKIEHFEHLKKLDIHGNKFSLGADTINLLNTLTDRGIFIYLISGEIYQKRPLPENIVC